jgi:hypothetical protein
MTDYDFWLEPESDRNKRIMSLVNDQLKGIIVDGYGKNEHPDLIRLAVWIDNNEMTKQFTYEELTEMAEVEQERFAGDYDDLADACETLHNEYNGEPDSNLVIDWEATWNYSYQYDFESASYTKRDEANPSDYFPMGTFAGAGTWIWRNN